MDEGNRGLRCRVRTRARRGAWAPTGGFRSSRASTAAVARTSAAGSASAASSAARRPRLSKRPRAHAAMTRVVGVRIVPHEPGERLRGGLPADLAQSHGHHRAHAVLGVGGKRRQRRHGAGIPQVAEGEDHHFADVGVVGREAWPAGVLPRRGRRACRGPHAATPRVEGSRSCKPADQRRAGAARPAHGERPHGVAPDHRIHGAQQGNEVGFARTHAPRVERGGGHPHEHGGTGHGQECAPARRAMIESDVQDGAHALGQGGRRRHGERAPLGGRRGRRTPGRLSSNCCA